MSLGCRCPIQCGEDINASLAKVRVGPWLADIVGPLLDAGDELKILARNKLDGAILATPALVDGKIYVRTESHLYAFGN